MNVNELSSRLERLERENRWMKRPAAVASYDDDGHAIWMAPN